METRVPALRADPTPAAAGRHESLLDMLRALQRSRGPIDADVLCDGGDFVRMLNYQLLSRDIPCLDAPVWLNWDVTSRCNCQCIHCAASADFDPNGRGRDHIDTDRALRLIDEMVALEIVTVVLSGGEPFIRRDIYRLIERLKEGGCFVTILTNGSLPMDHERLAELLDPTTDLIQISLDGPTAAIHNTQRKAKVFDRTIANIRILASLPLEVKLNMVLSPVNIDQAIPVYELARDLGVDTISYTANVPVGRGEALPGYDHARFLELSLALHRLSKRGDGPAIRNNTLLIPYAVPEIRALVPPASWSPFPRLRCLAGTTKAVLDPVGDLYPCPFLLYPEFKAGNVLEEGIQAVWKRGRGWKTLRGGRFFTGTKCERCEYLNLCRGECPGAAFGTHGTVDAPDPRCTWES